MPGGTWVATLDPTAEDKRRAREALLGLLPAQADVKAAEWLVDGLRWPMKARGSHCHAQSRGAVTSMGKSKDTVGAKILKARWRAGLTQEELAAKARLRVRTVSDLERGRVTCPRAGTLRLLGMLTPIEYELQISQAEPVA